TATEARATYFRSRPLAAAFASLSRPANTGRPLASGFPQSPEHETGYRSGREGGHWLIPHRLVESALEVRSDLLHALARFAALSSHAIGHALGSVRHAAELLGRLVLEIGNLIRLTGIGTLGHGTLLALPSSR